MDPGCCVHGDQQRPRGRGTSPGRRECCPLVETARRSGCRVRRIRNVGRYASLVVAGGCGNRLRPGVAARGIGQFSPCHGQAARNAHHVRLRILGSSQSVRDDVGALAGCCSGGGADVSRGSGSEQASTDCQQMDTDRDRCPCCRTGAFGAAATAHSGCPARAMPLAGQTGEVCIAGGPVSRRGPQGPAMGAAVDAANP